MMGNLAHSVVDDVTDGMKGWRGRSSVRRPARWRAAAVFLGLVASGVAWGQSTASTYRVIVNPHNAATSVPRRFLAEAFLKKTTRWPDGEALYPVDLAPDSPVRARFADEVLGRSLAAVRSYWQQLIFAGRGVPPPELDSDWAVVRYVLRNTGAVGYVSADAAVSLGGARVVVIK